MQWDTAIFVKRSFFNNSALPGGLLFWLPKRISPGFIRFRMLKQQALPGFCCHC
jgi:hypothetical protein